MNSNKDKFIFWMPCDFEKSKAAGASKDSKPVMKLKGIASTLERDSDGEVLDPEGFDLSFFLSGGMVNWHHQAKNNPLANIGEPEVAKIVPEGLYVECMLYEDSPLARDVFGLAQLLQKNSKTRRLGFSIEGKVLERDPMDETRITKAKITGLAVTHIPKNPATLCEIMKGERDGFDMEFEEDIEKLKKKKKSEDEDDEEMENKSLDSVSGAALKTESLDGTPKKAIDEDKKRDGLTKGEVFEKIFGDFPDIAISKSKRVYRIIEKTAENMNNGTQKQVITDEAIEKAYDMLGLSGIEKGEAPTVGSNGGGRTENARTRGGGTTYFKQSGESGEYSLMNKGESEDGSDDSPADEKVYVKKGEEFVEKGAEEGEEAEVEKGAENDINEVATNIVEKAKNLFGAEMGELFKGMFNDFEKGQTDKFKSVGLILQNIAGNQDNIAQRLSELEDSPSPANARTLTSVDRFAKGETGDLNTNGKPQVSLSQNRQQVLGLLNSVTFSKGEMNEFYAKGLSLFEAAGTLPADVRTSLEAQVGVKIVD